MTNITASIDLAQLDRDITLGLVHYPSEDGHTLVRLDEVKAILARRSLTSGALAEPVGEVILFGGDSDLKEVAWRKGKLPPVGTKLYVASFHDAAAPSIPQGFAWPSPPPGGQSHVLFDDGYAEGWAKAIDTVRTLLESAGAAAKTEQAPEHETIVQEGGNLVCTACGTTAEIAVVGFDSNMQKVDTATAAGAGSAQPEALDERALFMRAIDSTYPIPDTPHQSVAERAMSNREAFNKGWEQARAALARAPLPADADELKFNATRLRNVARLVGMESAMPEDDATLDGARGSVLGMIAGTLRNSAASAQPVDDARDAARLDFLDTNVHRFRMGWEVGAAPVGNLSVRSIIMGGKPIREAIDAAIEAHNRAGKEQG